MDEQIKNARMQLLVKARMGTEASPLGIAIRKNLTPEMVGRMKARQAITHGYLRKAEKNRRNPDLSPEELAIKNLDDGLQAVADLDDNLRKIALGGRDGMNAFDRLFRMLRQIEKHRVRPITGSTAVAGQAGVTGGALGALGGIAGVPALVAGSLGTGLGFLGGTVAGAASLSVLLTSPKFLSWLAQPLKFQSSPAALITQLSRMAKEEPELAEPLHDFMNTLNSAAVVTDDDEERRRRREQLLGAGG
jgi:hypothetical protein